MDNFQQIDPKYLALIQAGAGILAANNGRMPAGAAIGQGLLGGANAYQENLQNQQMMQMRNDQIDAQRQLFGARADEIAEQRRDKQQRNTTLQGVAQQYGLDPNVISAFPKIGEDLITSKLMPKAPKIGFTPSGVAYDVDNPTLQLGENYGKLDDNKPVNGYLVPDGQGGWKIDPVLYDAEQKMKRAGASSTSVTYGSPVAGVDANGNPVFFQPDKGGGAPSIVQGVKPKPDAPKAPTEGQAKAATFYSQMTSASKELDRIQKEGGYDPTQFASQVETSVASGLGNNLVSPTAQQARQAQNQWSESFLRIKTGAAATKDEVNMNVETFFPKVGDSKNVIEQKARMRKQAEADVAQMTQNPQAIKNSAMSSGWSAKKVNK
jgi:hypothetical protein